MKRSFFVWLISFSATSLVILCLIIVYFTAKNGIEKYIDVRENKTDVPYNEEAPEGFGIKLNLPQNEGLYFDLDFEDREIVVSWTPAGEKDAGSQVKYNIDISYDLFGELVDMTGGINVPEGGGEVRITGVTAAERIKEDPENAGVILSALVRSFCSKGLSKTELLYILENCESSDLSLVDLFAYKDILPEMFKNIRTKT